jgi:transposase
MHDTELYRHLLGLEPPWFVSKVELNIKEKKVDVWTEHEDNTKFPCPVCNKKYALYDHTEERRWRHLDSCEFMTILHARPPRVECPEHGIHRVKVPWAEDKARFTSMFERLAIDVLLESSVTGAMKILRISWDEAWHIVEKAVQRGMLRKKKIVIGYLGVDEKAIAKGHSYITVVCDLDRGTIEYVAEERRQASLDGFFEALTEEQLNGIKAIAMDMWEPYINSTLANVPDAEKKIVFDRYHIMRHMNEAVNTVRKTENRELVSTGDGTLKGTKYLWLYGEENLPQKHSERFEALKALNLKTGRAWAIKENLRELWDCPDQETANAHWKEWYSWAIRSRLKPVMMKATTIKDHVGNILTYFVHRITNAVTEAVNSTIQTIKKMACGFRNPEYFKIAIYFHCGGLDLYPTHSIP